jgi:hypothetical protein
MSVQTLSGQGKPCRGGVNPIMAAQTLSWQCKPYHGSTLSWQCKPYHGSTLSWQCKPYHGSATAVASGEASRVTANPLTPVLQMMPAQFTSAGRKKG